MSEFSEQDKTFENEPKRIDVPEHDDFDDAFSSVLGDPTQLEHVRTSNGGKKRLLTVLISCMVVVALVGGIFWIKVAVKPLKKETATFADPTAIMTRSADDFTEIKVQNENGDFRFVSKKEKVESIDESSDASSAEATEKTVWSMPGKYAKTIDADKLSEIASAVSGITATGTVEPGKKYGLDKPRCTVTVKDPVNGDFTLKIGVQAFEDCYVEYSADGKIYKAQAEDIEPLLFSQENITKAESIAGLSELADLSKSVNKKNNTFIDLKMTVSGKNFPKPLVIVMDPKQDEEQPYLAESPIKTAVDTDKANDLSEKLLTSMAVDEVYALNADAAKFKECGLDQPDVVLKISIGAAEHTLKIAALDEDTTLVVSDDSRTIYQSTAAADYLQYTAEDFYAD